MPSTIRERLSDRLLQAGVELGAERERLARSLRTSACDRHDYERAMSMLLTAQGVDTLLRWLAARLRPKSAVR